MPANKYNENKPRILKLFDEQDMIIGSYVATKIGVTTPTAMTYLRKMYMEGLLDFDTIGSKNIKVWKLKDG